MSDVYIIAASRPWLWDMAKRLQERIGRGFHLVRGREELTEELLQRLAPRYVFFPHWSWMIPESIWSRYECVIFHMTDLPLGRGGSPLQNLIAEGIYETRLTALRCQREVDAGPVYLKHDLCLHGSAEEIYIRAAKIVEQMIEEIIARSPQPAEQSGEPTYYRRRTPEQGDISVLKDIEKIYDFIRMLDAEGYPKAFVEIGHLRIEFSRAALRHGHVDASARIMLRQDKGDS